MFDAHCHLDLFPPEDPPAAVLARARAAGVRGLVIAGVGPLGWPGQAALVGPGVWACYGVHPWTAAAASDGGLEEDLSALEAWLPEHDVVALGELGLDFGRRMDRASFPRQERAFRAQLSLARALNLPLVLHVVAAQDRALAILQEEGLPSAGGMVHSWSGGPDKVRGFLDLGLSLSFCGNIVRSPRIQSAARLVPLDRLLVETDAPDQLPRDAVVGALRNEPAFLPVVLHALALARGAPLENVADATERNASRVFRG